MPVPDHLDSPVISGLDQIFPRLAKRRFRIDDIHRPGSADLEGPFHELVVFAGALISGSRFVPTLLGRPDAERRLPDFG